jgi:hypothetical protein
MREKAEANGADLLVVDTGDRVEGNGLYDSSKPKGIFTSDIFKGQHIDVLTSGNHELYKQNTSEAEFLTTVPNFKDHYLASNIDIIDPKTGDLVPLAQRFKKFTTSKQGIRIVAFGFLFDFTGNYNNTVVQPVEETIKEKWFQEAIRDHDVDLFLVVGHVPVQSREYNAIFRAIRKVQWDSPIQFFGGHYHIRDYVKYDSKSYGLASGRFMETIGFLSIDGLSTGGKKAAAHISRSSTFNRRYIDNNLFSFHHHTGLNETTFPTEKGRKVSLAIEKARLALQLDKIYGCAPQNFWMARAKYPSNDSIYSWLEEQVLPDSLHDESRSDKPGVVIFNSGGIRFDLFQGPFTRDTTFALSSFGNKFRYIKDIPYKKANRILEVLNKEPTIVMQSKPSRLHSPLAPPEQQSDSRHIVNDYPTSGRKRGDQANQMPLAIPASTFSESNPDPNLIPGYTTTDDAGDDGDDTVHSPISFYRIPNCIKAFLPASSSSSYSPSQPDDSAPEGVDLVYIDFIEPWIIMAANFAGLDLDIDRDADAYMPGETMTSLISRWVGKNWACEGES